MTGIELQTNASDAMNCSWICKRMQVQNTQCDNCRRVLYFGPSLSDSEGLGSRLLFAYLGFSSSIRVVILMNASFGIQSLSPKLEVSSPLARHPSGYLAARGDIKTRNTRREEGGNGASVAILSNTKQNHQRRIKLRRLLNTLAFKAH